MKDIFGFMKKCGHEELHFITDKKTGLKVIIAIHNTELGPAMGGVRMVDYKTEEEAIKDALKLSYAMTYKCAVVGERKGGGKAVIIGDPKKKTNELLMKFGEVVENMSGRFITGVDLNLTLEDSIIIHKKTKYIVARPESDKSLGKSGETAAYGVWKGLKACMKYMYGSDSLKDKIICVQGLGYLGGSLIPYLEKEGMKIIVSDINKKAVELIKEKHNVRVVAPEDVYETECDILCLCAIGGVLNESTIPKLRCKIVAGGANNQLKNPLKDAILLKERGILYAPDYVVNAGGVIQAICELEDLSLEDAKKRSDKIYNILLDVFNTTKEKNILTIQAAKMIVDKGLKNVSEPLP